MSVMLLAEYHLEFLRLKGGRTGSSESTHVKMSHCWKSHALAQSRCMRYPTMWYVRPAKAQISLRKRAV